MSLARRAAPSASGYTSTEPPPSIAAGRWLSSSFWSTRLSVKETFEA